MPDEMKNWLARLDAMRPERIVLGLERVRTVMAAMGIPERLPMRTVIVGGTNGKGSAVAYLEAVLKAAGHRVGAYTSPHVWRYNERVRVNGTPVADSLLVAAFDAVEAARGDTPLTYFEFGTLAAVHAFLHRKVSVAVLEVGLGGRLDAVNAFMPDLSLLMSVDLDHQAWLGTTREAIGREKAGIFRGGVPAVCGDPAPPQVIQEAAAALRTPLMQAGRDFHWEETGVDVWNWHAGHKVIPDLPMPALTGRHQVQNAAACVAGLTALQETLEFGEEAIRHGLRTASLPGRFQVLAPRRLGGPAIILDVAHNPAAARALAATLAGRVSGRLHAVFGMLADKDHAQTVEPLLGLVSGWYCADLPGPRAMTGAALTDVLQRLGVRACQSFSSPHVAFAAAEAGLGADDTLLVFGSFYALAALPENLFVKDVYDGNEGQSIRA